MTDLESRLRASLVFMEMRDHVERTDRMMREMTNAFLDLIEENKLLTEQLALANLKQQKQERAKAVTHDIGNVSYLLQKQAE